MYRVWVEGLRAARRVVVGVIGLTVLGVGLALLVLPGPAFVVIPIGLGILAIEFEWARRWLRRAREAYESASQRSGQDAKATGEAPPTPPPGPTPPDPKQ